MGFAAVLKKIPLFVRLSNKKNIKIGGKQYRTRGFFVNELAARESIVESEPWLDIVYRAALASKKGFFLDVGANIGQTLLKVLALDGDRPYVGFEPQVPCCFLVQRFIEDNDLQSHAILPVGLSNRDALVKLHTRGEGFDAAATTIENFRPASFYKESRYVSVRKGDSVIAEMKIPQISTIKIDVEGGELEVIEGLSQTIREHKPYVIFEVLNSYLILTGEKLDEQSTNFRQGRIEKIQAALAAHGYDIYQVLPERSLKKTTRIQPEPSGDLSTTNYVAVPKVRNDAFFRRYSGSVQDESRAA
jgi:FkbM family methyltransferase